LDLAAELIARFSFLSTFTKMMFVLIVFFHSHHATMAYVCQEQFQDGFITLPSLVVSNAAFPAVS
jgi:hypothetical protein